MTWAPWLSSTDIIWCLVTPKLVLSLVTVFANWTYCRFFILTYFTCFLDYCIIWHTLSAFKIQCNQFATHCFIYFANLSDLPCLPKLPECYSACFPKVPAYYPEILYCHSLPHCNANRDFAVTHNDWPLVGQQLLRFANYTAFFSAIIFLFTGLWIDAVTHY